LLNLGSEVFSEKGVGQELDLAFYWLIITVEVNIVARVEDQQLFGKDKIVDCFLAPTVVFLIRRTTFKPNSEPRPLLRKEVAFQAHLAAIVAG